jgi:NADH-quinone oxidoreductase subunit F
MESQANQTVPESILLRWAQTPGMQDLETYRQAGGYEAARRVAVGILSADEVIEAVIASGLRGKGGAGFPTGQKWAFIPRHAPTKYVVVNADEGEPGTFKDRALIEGCPHLLIEGILIAALTIGARKSYVYLRREFYRGARLLEAAIAQARAAGCVGERIFGTDRSVEIVPHTGAGAYIAGEESALLESLEGRRALPRLRPPFPAQAGLYQQPTLVQNVETLCHLPAIVTMGPARYRALGPPTLFSVSGAVMRPGVYELPLGTTLRALIFHHAGGLRPGRRFKAAFPGGLSSALLTEAHLDVPMDYDSLRAAGSMLGSAAVIVVDDAADMVEVAARAVEFYRHESCGKCTPCRIGTRNMSRILAKILRGQGQAGDLERLEVLAQRIRATAFCGLGQTAPNPVLSTLQHFRHEYIRRIPAFA